jgi:hypothetical protein
MDAITYIHARGHLAETMEKVCDDHAPSSSHAKIKRSKKRRTSYEQRHTAQRIRTRLVEEHSFEGAAIPL